MSAAPAPGAAPSRPAPVPAAGSLLAEAFAFEAAGRLRDALACHERATALDPDCGVLWRHRGNLLRQVGALGDAAECFERAIARGDAAELNAFFLSAVGVGAVAATAPAPFVGALFDQYADRFDDHLRGPLRYRAPEVLAERVGCGGATRFGSAVDLGCGTGLAGAAFRSCCRHLVGVDLSARMLAHAARRGVYDLLIHGDFLAAFEGGRGGHDLVVCCDALNYVGDLGPLFSGVRDALRRGGSFAFTAEAGDADGGYDLLPSLRYTHSEGYVRRLAGDFGFTVRAMHTEAIRSEADAAVAGWFVHLTRD